MSKVAIVTDSTTYFPQGMLRGLPVFSLPLHVCWGEDNYLDGIDIKPNEFYNRLQSAKVMPTTSQVTPGAFIELYKQLIAEDYDILSIHISAKLSGTYDSAIQAKDQLPGARITLIDSESTAMAMGFMAMAAGRASVEGATLSECVAVTEQAKTKTNVYFAVSTLEFLRRGGRIGGAAAFLGTAFDLKPILTLQDGKVEAIEKVRTMSKAIDRLQDIVEKRTNGARPIRLAALHANAPKEAGLLLERLRNHFGVSNVADAVITEVSPVIGTHTGPGTVGIVYMAGM